MPKVTEPVTWRSPLSAAQLQKKARLWQQIRAFFDARGVMEVQTPCLGAYSVTDPALHSLAVEVNGQRQWLQSSPEYYMKRLLASGSGPIYQIASVFRGEESGPRHRTEFSLLEWYRPGFDYRALMQEITQLLALWSDAAVTTMRYETLFEEVLALHPLDAPLSELRAACTGLASESAASCQRDDLLDYLIAFVIGPQLPKDRFTFICDYPASQASLARLCPDSRWAERFELYWGDLELANGFSELTDATLQQQRFEADIQQRQQRGLPAMQADPHLLAALAQGMDACAGVAVGLDRLLMVLWQQQSIENVAGFKP